MASNNNSPELMLNLSSTEEYTTQQHVALNAAGPGGNSMSPVHTRSKTEDTSPRRDTNRKWVRQMTRRIRDFMTNTNTCKKRVLTKIKCEENMKGSHKKTATKYGLGNIKFLHFNLRPNEF